MKIKKLSWKALLILAVCVVAVFSCYLLMRNSSNVDDKTEEGVAEQLVGTEVYGDEVANLPNKVELVLDSPSDYSEDVGRILARGELLVGTVSPENESEPFVIEKDGQFSGYCIGFAKYLADTLGVDLKVDNSAENYSELIKKVNRQEVDIALGNLSKTEERAAAVALSDGYIKMRYGLVVNRMFEAKNKINGDILFFLKDRPSRIAALKGSSYVTWAKQLFPKAEVVGVDLAPSEILKLVQSGQVDAMLDAEFFVVKELSDAPELYVDCASYMIGDKVDHICVALPASSIQLKEWINNCIELNGNYGLETIDVLIENYPEYFGKGGNTANG